MTEPPSLVVLFGHENDRLGHVGLSKAARLRCETVAQFLRSAPTEKSPVVLITGAFGAHFNETPEPHHRLMQVYLKQLLEDSCGSSNLQVRGAPTSFTFEDVAFIRRFALEENHRTLLLVTSSFHLRRVQFFAEKLLPDLAVSYSEAPDPDDLDEIVRKKEAEDLNSLRNGSEWADVPLPGKDQEFPAEVYKNAFEEHKHDDTVSYWLLASGFSVLIAPHLREAKQGEEFSSGCMFIASAIIGYLFWKLYLRYAKFAYVARLVLRVIETIYFSPGFSYNHKKYFRGYGFGNPYTSRTTLGLLVGMLIIANFFSGAALLDWRIFFR